MNRITHLECAVYGLLRIRGPHAQRGLPARASRDDYDSAAGMLREIAKATGETPDALCRRLHIQGATRRMVMPQGTTNFRRTAADRQRVYAARKPLRKEPQHLRDQRRAQGLGIVLDSPEWAALMERDRAFEAKLARLRAEAGPPHPDRDQYHAAKQR